MNAIRRPRRRPRVRSLSFRSLGWLLPRVAFTAALDIDGNPFVLDGRWRGVIARKPTSEVRRLLTSYLARHPERRIVG